MTDRNPAQRPTAALALLVALFGVACIAGGAVLAATSEVPAVATAFWRMALAAPICLALAFLAEGPALWRSLARLLARGGVWIAGAAFALTLIFWYAGQRLSSVASTSALHNLAPVLLVTVGWLFHGRKPRVTTALGVAAATAGAILVALHGGSITERTLQGDTLACFAAAALAVYYAQITRLGGVAGAWPIMAVVSLIAAPILLATTLVFEAQAIPATASGWVKLVALAVLAQAMGQACLARAARRLGPVGISAAALAEPGLAAALAIGLLAAPAHAAQLLGVALISAGIWFSQDLRRRAA